MEKTVHLRGESNNYGKLQQLAHVRAKERILEVLSDWGVHTVINTRTPVNKVDLIYDKPTLYILPVFMDVLQKDRDRVTIEENGFKIIISAENDNLDNTKENICYNGTVVGSYYRDRNLIIAYFNPFPLEPRINKFKSALALLQAEKPVFNCFDNSEALTKMSLKRHSAVFIKNIQKSLILTTKDIQTHKDDISRMGRQIISKHQDIRIKALTLISIASMLENFPAEFERSVLEIRTLPFVDNVTVTSDGIKIDFGDINILHNKINYYIGHMEGVISPTDVRFYNLNNKKDGYNHPHVYSRGDACEGGFRKDFSDLLGQLHFKRLVFLMSQFLRHYNPKSPVTNISQWTKKKVVKKK